MELVKGSVPYKFVHHVIKNNADSISEGDEVLWKFNRGRINFCEMCRHVFLWYPMYWLGHALIISFLLSGLLVFPVVFDFSLATKIYAIIALVIGTFAGFFGFINWSAYIQNKKRMNFSELSEEEQDAILEQKVIKDQKSKNFWKNVGKVLSVPAAWFFKTLLFIITLGGIIPFICGVIYTGAKAVKQKICPFINVVEADTAKGEN